MAFPSGMKWNCGWIYDAIPGVRNNVRAYAITMNATKAISRGQMPSVCVHATGMDER